MHKSFYASGFLYHQKSQQILLQQQNSADETSSWSLFGKPSIKDKTGEEIIKDIFEEFDLKLSLKNINLIYTYFSKEKNKEHNVYYAEVKKLHKFSPSKKTELAWFSFKQIQKMNLSDQAKHDIMVGLRVIQSSIRRTLGERTIG